MLLRLAAISAIVPAMLAAEQAWSKTYVYTCTTQAVSTSGGPVPGTSYESYFRAGLGNPVGTLINSFCPSALNDCVQNRARFRECCEVTAAFAADINYTSQVQPAFSGSGRHYCNDALPTPTPGPTPDPSTSGAVLFYHDDGYCRESDYIAAVTASTNCDNFRSYPSVWGVKINGQCKDISDMDAYSACQQYKGSAGGIGIYHDDGRCDSSNLITSVGPQTDCTTLRGMSSAWGVSIHGQCIDIPDTSAEDACMRYKDR